MKELIEYDNRRIIITAYNGKTERDLVMYKFSRAEDNPPKLKDLLFFLSHCIDSNIPLEQLTNDEIIYILYSIRGISVSDSLSLQFKCPDCGNAFKVESEISSIYTKSTFREPGASETITKVEKVLNPGYFEDSESYIKDTILDTLTMSSYDRLLRYIDKHKTKFNYTREIECLECHNKHKMDLRDLNILCACFSNFDVMGFYNSLNSLVYYGKYDISSLLNDVLPFEREIITDLIQKEIDKQAEFQNKYTKSKT